jgi:hypothetical protein
MAYVFSILNLVLTIYFMIFCSDVLLSKVIYYEKNHFIIFFHKIEVIGMLVFFILLSIIRLIRELKFFGVVPHTETPFFNNYMLVFFAILFICVLLILKRFYFMYWG